MQVWHAEAVEAATWMLAGIVRVPFNAEAFGSSLHDQPTRLAQGVGESASWFGINFTAHCNAAVHHHVALTSQHIAMLRCINSNDAPCS